jgi:hypothetical protein
MTAQEKSVLGAQPFLRGLPDHQVATLAALCGHVAVPTGRRLFDEDARAVRTACDSDPALGYELSRRVAGIVVRRLEATHARLIDAYARAEMTP